MFWLSIILLLAAALLVLLALFLPLSRGPELAYALVALAVVLVALGWYLAPGWPIASDKVSSSTPSSDATSTIEFINNTPVDLLLGTTEIVNTNWLIPSRGQRTLTLNNNAPGQLGRRFWARAGCRYDQRYGKAQCLVGDCGQRYSCDGRSGQIPVSLAEFCLGCDDGLTYYDVSLVDGYTLSIDIEPLDLMPAPNPDPHWNVTGLCRLDRDLRDTCPPAFQLRASERSGYIDGPDYVLGCFSDCGRYEYPTTPDPDCDPATDERCANWRRYCCTSRTNNNSCTSDSACRDGDVCWIEPGRSKCACRGWTSGASCAPDICTFQTPDAQPPLAQCPDGSCLGVDSLHEVCPNAYAWPNDPQTHTSNSRRWRVVFGAKAPLPPTINFFPQCSSLPANYNYQRALSECGARTGLAGAKREGSWDCDVTALDQTTEGTVCEWSSADGLPA